MRCMRCMRASVFFEATGLRLNWPWLSTQSEIWSIPIGKCDVLFLPAPLPSYDSFLCQYWLVSFIISSLSSHFPSFTYLNHRVYIGICRLICDCSYLHTLSMSRSSISTPIDFSLSSHRLSMVLMPVSHQCHSDIEGLCIRHLPAVTLLSSSYARTLLCN